MHNEEKMRKNDGFLPLLNIIRQHWRLLLFCSCCCAVAAFLVAKYYIHPKYRADVMIYIGRLKYDNPESDTQKTLPRTPSHEDPNAILSRELYVGSQLVFDYTELAKSRMVLNKAKEKILKENPKYLVPFSMESSMRKNTRLLTLSVTAEDPEAACYIANTLSDVFGEEISTLLEMQKFKSIDRAKKAVKTYPRPWLFAHIAFFISGGLGILFFVLKGIFDTCFHTSEQIARALNLPVIGSVPTDREMAKHSVATEADIGHIVTLNNDQTQKRFGIREAFWGIRTNLLYSDLHSQEGARIIALTSALPGEGKTFVATNLAVTLADFGHRTLIINCDLRKPALSIALNVYNKVGLVNVLVDHYPVKDALCKNLFDRKLDALLCGPIPLNPLKLLDSAEFKGLLQEMRKEYDYIILDTPPCLEVSDGICLGKMADGIIVVSRLEVLREDNAVALNDLLQQAKVTPIGMVINGVPAHRNGYYRGHYGQEKSKTESTN